MSDSIAVRLVVKLTKCNHELVKKTLKALQLPADGTLKACVERLAVHYEKHASEMDIATCDTCGGDADAALPECPYCGDAGLVDTGEEDSTGEVAPPPNPVEEVVEAPLRSKKKSAPEQAEPSTKSKAKPAKTKAEPSTKSKAKPAKNAPSADEAEVVTLPTPHAKDHSKARIIQAKSGELPFDEDTGEVIVDTRAALVTTADLDAKVAAIRQCVTEGAVALHRLGAHAAEISTGGLWKLRTNKAGVPMFRNFKQFCVEELGMTAVHVYRAMQVAKEFTSDAIQGLSGRQVRLVLQVPPAEREAALTATKSGDAAAITDRANALRGGNKPLPDPKKAVTVAMAMGHQKVKLYRRPTTDVEKVGDTETAKPAKTMKDHPWFVIDMANKVRMTVKLSADAKGNIVADVEFRRGVQLV